MLIYAVDDEPLLLKHLLMQIKKADPQAQVIGFERSMKALEEARLSKRAPDVVFLDIEMPVIDGLTFAKEMRKISDVVNVIFVTGYSEYAVASYSLYASGYVLKPVSEQRIKEELNNLRYPIVTDNEYLLNVNTFGNFEVFSNGVPVKFSRSKAKEIFAYLIDRNGASVSIKEIASVLYEDRIYSTSVKNQIQTYISSLNNTLQNVQAQCVLYRGFNSIAVLPEFIDCDYYRFLNNERDALDKYSEEYMNQYSWAETKNAYISRCKKERKKQ